MIHRTPITSETLVTRRLHLEFFKKDHAMCLFKGLQDPRIYLFIPDDPPADLSVLQKRYEILEKGVSPNGEELWLNWAIQLQNGTYIGYVQATVFQDDTASLAYVVFPQFWRKGYAKEACQRVVNFLFEGKHAALITANTNTKNEASIALLHSLGFYHVRSISNAETIRGVPSDEHVFHLSKS